MRQNSFKQVTESQRQTGQQEASSRHRMAEEEMGVRGQIKGHLKRKCDEQYARALAEQKITYQDWLLQVEKAGRTDPETEGKIQEAARSGGGILLLSISEAVLADRARERIAVFFDEHPKVLLAYGDEDVWEPGEEALPRNPWFQKSWSPGSFCGTSVMGSLLALRLSWAEELAKPALPSQKQGDGEECPIFLRQGHEAFRKLFATSAWKAYQNSGLSSGFLEIKVSLPAWQDLQAFLAWKAGGFKKGCEQIGHIPHILCHLTGDAPRKQYCHGRCLPPEDLLTEEKESAGGAECTEAVQSELISVIIPTKDHPAQLGTALCSLEENTAGEKVEVIVVDNGSTLANRGETERLLSQISFPHSYLWRPMEFNFSRMCNLGAEQARGALLLFLNDDVEFRCKGTLAAMAGWARLPFTGAVGLRLYYPYSDRLQHDGIINMAREPIHQNYQAVQPPDKNTDKSMDKSPDKDADENLARYPDKNPDQYPHQDPSRDTDENPGKNHDKSLNRKDGAGSYGENVTAVTAACLMIPADRFREAGGFPEELRVAYNDVDLCFTLRELGYHNFILRSFYAWHHESLSRGQERSREDRKRLALERELLYKRHPGMWGRDSYYSDRFDLHYRGSAPGEAYRIARNVPDPLNGRPLSLPWVGGTFPGRIRHLRQDPCLRFTVEECDEGQIRGQYVVLGDDNACYESWLLCYPVTGEETGELLEGETTRPLCPDLTRREEADKCYRCAVRGQYRQELEKEFDGEMRACLNGIWITLGQPGGFRTAEALPEGRYLLGLMVKNKISGQGLYRWSGRVLVLQEEEVLADSRDKGSNKNPEKNGEEGPAPDSKSDSVDGPGSGLAGTSNNNFAKQESFVKMETGKGRRG